jgi:hypothetical protein
VYVVFFINYFTVYILFITLYFTYQQKIEWHKVADLPTWIKSRDRDTPYHCGGGCVKYGSSRFYMVVPFVRYANVEEKPIL